MRIIDLRDHIDKKFDHLEKRIDDLERSRAFVSGVWKALTVMGSVGVAVLGIYLKMRG